MSCGLMNVKLMCKKIFMILCKMLFLVRVFLIYKKNYNGISYFSYEACFIYDLIRFSHGVLLNVLTFQKGYSCATERDELTIETAATGVESYAFISVLHISIISGSSSYDTIDTWSQLILSNKKSLQLEVEQVFSNLYKMNRVKNAIDLV